MIAVGIIGRQLIVKSVRAVVVLLMLALTFPALAQESQGQNQQQHVNSLTIRERQIVLIVAEGLSNKEVGRQLNLSEGTVKVHLHNIYNKLGVKNRTALVAIAHAYREELMRQ